MVVYNSVYPFIQIPQLLGLEPIKSNKVGFEGLEIWFDNDTARLYFQWFQDQNDCLKSFFVNYEQELIDSYCYKLKHIKIGEKLFYNENQLAEFINKHIASYIFSYVEMEIGMTNGDL